MKSRNSSKWSPIALAFRSSTRSSVSFQIGAWGLLAGLFAGVLAHAPSAFGITQSQDSSEANLVQASFMMVSELVAAAVGPDKNRPAVATDEIHVDGFNPGTKISLKDRDGQIVCRRTIDSQGGAACQNLREGSYTMEVELRHAGKSRPQTAEVRSGTWTHFSFPDSTKPPSPMPESKTLK